MMMMMMMTTTNIHSVMRATYDFNESIEMELHINDNALIGPTTRQNLVIVVAEQIREQPLTAVQTICLQKYNITIYIT